MASSQDIKRILVVGGGAGIGASIVGSILAQTDNVQIVVFDLDFAGLSGIVKALHGKSGLSREEFTAVSRLEAMRGDVRSSQDRALVMKKCEEYMGGVDTFIYCAGLITPIERIENMNLERVKETFDVNVFGCMAMVQLCLPHLRQSRLRNSLNAGFGKIIILSSACDTSIAYSGWSPYCTTKAALTRFVSCLAHEERLLSVQGVYPKLTRTQMVREVIAGSYAGVMADHEIERFRVWDEIGDEMVEVPSKCGKAVAKLALGWVEGGKSGETLYYDEHVPTKVVGT